MKNLKVGKTRKKIGKLASGAKSPTREQLIEAFWDCQNLLGHQPSSTEINQGKFRYHYYQKEYGSWGKFLSSLGLTSPFKRIYTREALDAEYDRVKSHVGKVPRWKDMIAHSKYRAGLYAEKFGSFAEYQRSRGDKQMFGRSVTTKEFIAEYNRIRKKLGRTPTFGEFRAHTNFHDPHFSVRSLFGGYKAFLKKMNEPSFRQFRHQRYMEGVRKEFYRLKKKLGRSPSRTEFNKSGKFSVEKLVPYYGNWSKYVLSIGEKPHKLIPWDVKKKRTKKIIR